MAPLNRPGSPARLLFGTLLFLGGCGDPLYDHSFRGDPIYRSSRTITWNADSPADPTDLRISLFFNPGQPGNVDLDSWVEFRPSITPIPILPTQIDFNIFDRPTPDLLAHAADGTPLGYGTASMLTYRDSNHDGQRSVDEPILGPMQTWMFLYLPEPMAASRLPTDRDMAEGFYRVFAPQTCGQTPPGPLTPGDCGVPLGGKCATDRDCNGGYCLTQTKLPWRAGYCTIQEPPKNGCRPAAAVYYRRPVQTVIPQGVVGYYLRPCTQDADCLRDNDATQRLYSCDKGLGGCTPVDPLGGNVGTPVNIEPFCGSGIFVPKS